MLSASSSLTLGDLRYDTHTVRLRLRRTLLPALDRLEVELPRDVRFEARPGDDVELELASEGEPVRVFTGRVSAVARKLGALVVTAHNGGLELARLRPSLAAEAQDAGELIEALCAQAEIELGAVDSGPRLALYVVDGRATAAQEIARLARLFDAAASFDGDGRLHVEAFDASGHAGEFAWKHGREVLDANIERWAAERSTLTLVGEGGGDPGSAQALWVAHDFLAGGAPAAGVDARVSGEPLMRTVDDARGAALARMKHAARHRARVKLHAWLAPTLTAGSRLEVQELPDALGPLELIACEVVHELDPRRGAYTRVLGVEQGAGDDLLGAALGALGGLLG